MKKLTLAGGSVPGSDHRAALNLKNNQDAFLVSDSGEFSLGIVADGNGDNPNSEVGAKLGVQLLKCMLIPQLTRAQASLAKAEHRDVALQILQSTLRRAEMDVLAHVRTLALAMTLQGESLSTTLRRYFSFTLGGFIITPKWSAVFFCGDGVYALNDKVTVLGPFAGNIPPYPIYQLFDTEDFSTNCPDVQLKVLEVLPTEDLQSALVGTDGVCHLIDAVDKKLPGRTDSVGNLSQFWTDSSFVSNPDALRRRLALITRDVVRVSRDDKTQLINEPGLLKDDTTMVVVQRA
jgi:Protein phosphatase 2C